MAQSFLAGLLGVDDAVASQLPELCVNFHTSVHNLSARCEGQGAALQESVYTLCVRLILRLLGL